jgi:hypothetical protein
MNDVGKSRRALRRRVAKLWRVLVVGGAVMAAACGTTSKAKDGKSGASSGSSSGDSKGAQGGGAQSW